MRRQRGRPRLPDAKVAVTLRLTPAALAKIKASSPNWRAALAKAIEEAADDVPDWVPRARAFLGTSAQNGHQE